MINYLATLHMDVQTQSKFTATPSGTTLMDTSAVLFF